MLAVEHAPPASTRECRSVRLGEELRSLLVRVAVAVLARPEGLLLLLLAVLDRLLSFTGGEEGLHWRPPAPGTLVAGAAFAACALAGPLLFYTWAGGSILPTTYAAKGGGGLRLLPDFHYLFNVVGVFFRLQPWMTLLAGAGAVSLAERHSDASS